MPNNSFVEQAKIVQAFVSAVPATADPAWVSLKNYSRAAVIISVKNATTVTGSAVTLKQATAIAGTGTKVLPFTRVAANLDISAGDALVDTAVTANTFTTLTTDSKNATYVIDVHHDMLDINGGFDCFRVELANATAATLSVIYVLFGSTFGGASMPTAVAN